MASKLEMYSALADRTAHQITNSFSEWTAFLKTAARLYKYPFHEQLMICSLPLTNCMLAA